MKDVKDKLCYINISKSSSEQILGSAKPRVVRSVLVTVVIKTEIYTMHAN